MDLGADDYLIKPSTAEELLGAIAARLEKQAALRQWFAAQSQSVSESPVVDTVKPAAPIFPSLPHLSKVFHFIGSIITNRLPYMTWLRSWLPPSLPY